MSPNEARARLRELLGPIRAHAVEEFTVPDIQDAIRLLEIQYDPELWDREATTDLYAMVDEAGFTLLTPLEALFEEAE